MKITVTVKKEIEIDEDEVRRNYTGYVQQLIEREKKVLSDDYLNWLVEFIKREEWFDDEANRVGYCGKYTEEEQEKIHLVSTLFSIVSNYYEKQGIDYDVKKADFFNQGVTVNLTEEVAIEMRIWCGQGAVTDVSHIEKGTGKVHIKTVIAARAK